MAWRRTLATGRGGVHSFYRILILKTIDTLIPDIQKLFDGHDLTPDVLSAFAGDLIKNFDERFQRYGKEYEPGLYLSNIGKPFRQLWFQIRSGLKPEPLTPESKLKFLYGDILEDLLLLLAVEAGHTVECSQKNVEVDGVRGRIDCLIDGCLVDVKSASSYSFDKFETGAIRDDDPFGYIGQLASYSLGLGGVDGYFLVIDKTLGKLCLLKISKDELCEYDIRNRITRIKEVLSRNVPPDERCYAETRDGVSKTAPAGNGNLYLSPGCSYCDHKFNCWRDTNGGRGLRTFIYSSGPKYFTKVVKEPKVYEKP